jgi:guanosine-3',5'-bis(diphosphate) 3'-pyrophosphohydrolase
VIISHFLIPYIFRMEETLERITAFADQAHGQQRRKYTPERYIVHPVRVMKICREYSDDLTLLAAALLHDVLEDTPVGPAEVLEFLRRVMNGSQAQRTLQLVVELTDVYVKSQFPHLNRPTRKDREAERMEQISAGAQTVKYADIMDNGIEVVQHDPVFARQYLRESKALLLRMTRGDQRLYPRALQTVDECLRMVSA